MPFKIDIHPELHLLISYITTYDVTEDEINAYMDRVVAFGNDFYEAGATHLYHIFVVDPLEFSFVKGLRAVRTIQQNRGLIAMRKRLNAMTIIVGQTPKPFQIFITLISRPSFGGRKMMVFPKLEPALAFVRFDIDYRKRESQPSSETVDTAASRSGSDQGL